MNPLPMALTKNLSPPLFYKQSSSNFYKKSIISFETLSAEIFLLTKIKFY